MESSRLALLGHFRGRASLALPDTKGGAYATHPGRFLRVVPPPPVVADRGLDQQAPGGTGSRRARGGGLMLAIQAFPMSTALFGLTTSAGPL